MNRAACRFAQVALTLLAPVASAAEEPSSPAFPATSAPLPLGLGPQGFFLGRPESGFQLRIRGVLQVDGRDYLRPVPYVPDTFLIRRARIYIEGTAADFADFRILPDYGEGQLQLLDAFVDLHLRAMPWVRVRVGKFKSPFGLERLEAEQALAFVERGLPTDLAPDRDIGVSVHGEPLGGAALYELALVLSAVFYRTLFAGGAPGGDRAPEDVLAARKSAGVFLEHRLRDP